MKSLSICEWNAENANLVLALVISLSLSPSLETGLHFCRYIFLQARSFATASHWHYTWKILHFTLFLFPSPYFLLFSPPSFLSLSLSICLLPFLPLSFLSIHSTPIKNDSRVRLALQKYDALTIHCKPNAFNPRNEKTENHVHSEIQRLKNSDTPLIHNESFYFLKFVNLFLLLHFALISWLNPLVS